jgi:hypothetical protein
MDTPEAATRPLTLGEQAGTHTESITVALRDVEDYLGRITRRWDPAEPGSLDYLADKAHQLHAAAERLTSVFDAAVQVGAR